MLIFQVLGVEFIPPTQTNDASNQVERQKSPIPSFSLFFPVKANLETFERTTLSIQVLRESLLSSEKAAFNYRGNFPGWDSMDSCWLLLSTYWEKSFQNLSKAGRKRERRLNLSLNRAPISSSSPESGVWTTQQRYGKELGKEAPDTSWALPAPPSELWRMSIMTTETRTVGKQSNYLDDSGKQPQIKPNWGVNTYMHHFLLTLGICRVNVSIVVQTLWPVALVLHSARMGKAWDGAAMHIFPHMGSLEVVK